MWKGKPVLGAISGFMFGLFLGPTLWLWGVIPFHSPVMWILPLVGIVLGLVMAAWAPFGKGRAAAPAADDTATPSDPEDAMDEPVAEVAGQEPAQEAAMDGDEMSEDDE